MNYQYQQPRDILKEYIRSVLVLDGNAEPDPSSLPLFTNNMPALFCRTDKEQVVELSLYGRSAPGEQWEAGKDQTIIAYFFKPFALAAFFNIPAKKLLETAIELSTWDAHKTNALKTQLAYAGTIAEKLLVLEHLLIRQLEEQKRECAIIRYATDEIMNDPGTEILSQLLDKLKISERTFQRIFKKFIGISPGQYRRICQFHSSFAQVRSNDFEKLTDVAYDNGFADQSHFIRSFKEFTATTPKDYLKSGLKTKKDQ